MVKLSTELFVIGASIHNTEAQVLADLAIPRDDLTRKLKNLTQECNLYDALLLSTCNRTEIYFTSNADCNQIEEQIKKWLLSQCSQKTDITEKDLYFLTQKEAITHLFRVVCGLDSMIIGETEISGQMQQAFEASLLINQTSSFFKQLFFAAFRTGKRSRTETAISKGSTSIASAAVHMAQRITGNLAKRKVLVVGAGDTAKKVCSHLQSKNAQITIANRTLEKARTIADKYYAEYRALTELKVLIPFMDVIICAVSSDSPVLTYEMLQSTTKSRKELLHIIDLSMPLAVQRSISEMKDVFLSDIDDLKKMVSMNLALRSSAQTQVEEIIDQEIKTFCLEQETLELGPLISSLRTSFEEIRQNEIEKRKDKMNSDTYLLVDQVTRSIINKLLHSPTVGIRDLADDNNLKAEKLHFIQKLFNLNCDKKKDEANEN